MWEKKYFLHETRELNAGEQYQVLIGIWNSYGGQHRRPVITVQKSKYSYALGTKFIVLREDEREIVTVIHEICHTLRYGSATNPHGVGFVKMFIKLLSEYASEFAVDPSLFNYDKLYSEMKKVKLL